MARVLIHYDIKNEVFRTQFQAAISNETFAPRFTMQSESVYAAAADSTPTGLDSVRRAVKHVLKDAPKGTNVFLERPGTTDNVPDIIQERIV
jgi:hypothetical protein